MTWSIQDFRPVSSRGKDTRGIDLNTVGWENNEGVIGACRHFWWQLFIHLIHRTFTTSGLKFILTRNLLFDLLPKYPSSHYQKMLIQIFLLFLRQGVPQWWYRSLKFFPLLDLQTNISTFYAHHVTPYTLNELFHSARIRRICSSNETFKMRCNELTQTRYLLRTEVDTISVSSTMTTCSCYQTPANTSDSPTRIPLVIGYHPAIRSISSISSQTHLHSLILSTLCHSAEIHISC